MADLKTVPQIFGYQGEYIGGYEELKKYLEKT
jgi:glutaredoxin-related protein